MALMEYGAQWKKIRKTMGMFTSMTEVKKFSKPMELESTVMLHEYIQDPNNYFRYHARFTNWVVMTVAFDRRTEKDDKLVVSHGFILPTQNMILDQFTPVLAAMQPGHTR